MGTPLCDEDGSGGRRRRGVQRERRLASLHGRRPGAKWNDVAAERKRYNSDRQRNDRCFMTPRRLAAAAAATVGATYILHLDRLRVVASAGNNSRRVCFRAPQVVQRTAELSLSLSLSRNYKARPPGG